MVVTVLSLHRRHRVKRFRGASCHLMRQLINNTYLQNVFPSHVADLHVSPPQTGKEEQGDDDTPLSGEKRTQSPLVCLSAVASETIQIKYRQNKLHYRYDWHILIYIGQERNTYFKKYIKSINLPKEDRFIEPKALSLSIPSSSIFLHRQY